MNKQETLARIRAELKAIEEHNGNVVELDSNIKFRLDNIGYSLKRIADSLETVAQLMIKDRQDRM